jgi:hypothetical protein
LEASTGFPPRIFASCIKDLWAMQATGPRSLVTCQQSTRLDWKLYEENRYNIPNAGLGREFVRPKRRPKSDGSGQTGNSADSQADEKLVLGSAQFGRGSKRKAKTDPWSWSGNLTAAWAQVAIAKESLKAALLANPENVADIQTKATDLANALSTGSVQMALHLAKISQVLTPAQRVQLEGAWSRRMHDWGQRLRGPMEGPSKDQCPSQRKDQSEDGG